MHAQHKNAFANRRLIVAQVILCWHLCHLSDKILDFIFIVTRHYLWERVIDKLWKTDSYFTALKTKQTTQNSVYVN